VLPSLAAYLLATLSLLQSAPVSSAPDLKNRVGDFFSCSSDQVVSHAPATPVNIGKNQIYGYENASGIPHYRARYYNPNIGRFISEDPIGFEAGDYHVIRYVENFPTNAFDPSGLQTAVEWKAMSKFQKRVEVSFAALLGNISALVYCAKDNIEIETELSTPIIEDPTPFLNWVKNTALSVGLAAGLIEFNPSQARAYAAAFSAGAVFAYDSYCLNQ